jgi:hypothetical protein
VLYTQLSNIAGEGQRRRTRGDLQEAGGRTAAAVAIAFVGPVLHVYPRARAADNSVHFLNVCNSYSQQKNKDEGLNLQLAWQQQPAQQWQLFCLRADAQAAL